MNISKIKSAIRNGIRLTGLSIIMILIMIPVFIFAILPMAIDLAYQSIKRRLQHA